MKYDPTIHHRRSIRLREYDYAQAGAYFITICTQDRRCLFGQIVDGGMWLNDAGKMVLRWYSEMENKFPDIQCDAFICMPNHVHFVVVNVGADLRVRPENETASPENVRTCGVGQTHGGMIGQTHGRTHGQTHRSAPTGKRISTDHIVSEHTGSSLHRVVQWFKTMATNEVRDESELNRIREYIGNNPAQWEKDNLFISSDLYGRTAVRPNASHEVRAKYASEEWMV